MPTNTSPKVEFDRLRTLATYLTHLHCIYFRRVASDRDWIMNQVETGIGQVPALSNANRGDLVRSPFPLLWPARLQTWLIVP